MSIRLWALVVTLAASVAGQCPWQRDVKELQSACICAYNLGHELSVQCDVADFSLLLAALNKHVRGIPLDLLYVNNSTVVELTDGIFKNFKINNIQLSGCRIRGIAPGAFRGQEDTLKNLNLQDNELSEVPVESLRDLGKLTLLDLSRNHITSVPDDAFATLKLATLKLADNNLTISSEAFRGLEGTLKNLNLKGTRQKKLPESIRGLHTLAFLDLAQNSVRDLGSGVLSQMHSLTALNLERNLVQAVDKDVFKGVNDTLSSLSLLNNLITEFPTKALNTLTELRVLDIGFNLITELPKIAFSGTPSLTLLALDGNPMATVPAGAFAHLNNTLRGLSLGGRFLNCDCKMRWVAEWIHNLDLQVTSRERNPQFCGSPSKLRDRSFYQIQPEEFICSSGNEVDSFPPPSTKKNPFEYPSTARVPETTATTSPRPLTSRRTTPTTTTTTTKTTTTTTTTPRPTRTTTFSTTSRKTTPSTTTPHPTTTTTQTSQRASPSPSIVVTTRGGRPKQTHQSPPWRKRPSVLLGYPDDPTSRPEEVIVKNAYRQDSSVIIQWDSETSNILGFRVVYRLFGDKVFKQGPPLEASEREFKIKNVPSQECIVVCVISLEDVNVSPDTVPYPQCREVRTVTPSTNNMDKITIAASAAICGTVVIAVIVFIATNRRRSRKLHTLQKSSVLPPASVPTTAAPLSSLATLSAFTTHKEWDQVSMYSNRSIPRARVYQMDRPGSYGMHHHQHHHHRHVDTGSVNAGYVADDMRSHASQFSSKTGKPRSLADGQSQRSYSGLSGKYLSGNSFNSGHSLSRPELRQSRQSLAAPSMSDRLSRASYTSQTSQRSPRRQRPKSRTRDQMRSSSRFSAAGSTHSLTGYDTSDNWTDHDMDIYMARNATRGGLVQL